MPHTKDGVAQPLRYESRYELKYVECVECVEVLEHCDTEFKIETLNSLLVVASFETPTYLPVAPSQTSHIADDQEFTFRHVTKSRPNPVSTMA